MKRVSMRMSSVLSAGVNKSRFRIKRFPEVGRHPGKRLLYLVEFITKSLKSGSLCLKGGLTKPTMALMPFSPAF